MCKPYQTPTWLNTRTRKTPLITCRFQPSVQVAKWYETEQKTNSAGHWCNSSLWNVTSHQVLGAWQQGGISQYHVETYMNRYTTAIDTPCFTLHILLQPKQKSKLRCHFELRVLSWGDSAIAGPSTQVVPLWHQCLQDQAVLRVCYKDCLQKHLTWNMKNTIK